MCERLHRAYVAIAKTALPPMLSGVLNGERYQGPHLGWVALTNVGHRHADGSILGYAALLPSTASDEELARHRLTLSALSALSGPAGRPMRFRLADEPPRLTLKPSRWIGPSCVWRTATPVVWEQFPRRGRHERIIQRMCDHVGLPEPASSRYGDKTALAGAFEARRYGARRYRGSYISHLKLTFNEPVYGPIVLGRGRYFGLGLFGPEGNAL